MFSKKSFWLIFVILVIFGAIFVVKNFPQMMSFVNVEIKMDRKQALLQSEFFAEKLALGLLEYEQAVIFDTDYNTQIYVELEGGGKDVFNEIIAEHYYKPYKWKVRHFTENEVKEVTFWFTPKGEFYGFKEKLPETEERVNVFEEDALKMSKDFAIDNFQTNFTEYDLIETKKNEEKSGRVDYTFVYQHNGRQINEAFYRLQITVSGDKVSEFRHFVKTPEAFSRRYSEMRSANNTIASAGSIAMAIFYGFGGILIGIFILLRKRWLIWKKPLIWAFIVAVFGFITQFNNLPLTWFWYDTAISKGSFLFQTIIQNFMMFLQDFLLLALSFMAAESLTRKAFPQHLQFWKIWDKGVANSKQVLGNTLAGYFVAILSLVFITTFYYFTTNYLGWWNPASLSTDPNSLATYFPWFSAIANSLHAGFWEECLFRAVPLAGAVLIGRKLGKEKLWLGIGLVLQAVIFGMGHANYAAQPAYARVVELLIPSLYFAFLYLRFGLLTAVLMHFVFDAILMSLPIWITSARGIWLERILFLLLFFIPLFIVIYRRIQAKKWVEILPQKFNFNWQPKIEKVHRKIGKNAYQTTYFNQNSVRPMLLLGIIGIAIWIGITEFSNHYLPLKISRKEAIATAKAELEKQNIHLSEDWQVLTKIWDHTTFEHRFIWQEGNENLFKQFIGKFIDGASWRVRFVRFEGEVAEKAEEYNIFVREKGRVVRFWHRLPENREGAFLEKEDALKLSKQALQNVYGINQNMLSEKSASPTELPNRRDWKFTFIDSVNYKFPQSELRYNTVIAGDLPTNVVRNIHPSEEWLRRERNEQKVAKTLRNFLYILVLLFYFAAVVIGVIKWTKKEFSLHKFFLFFGVLFISKFFAFWNSWPSIMADFSTSAPLNNQIFTTIFSALIGMLFVSFALAVIAGFIKKWINNYDEKLTLPAFSWGGITVAIIAIAAIYLPSTQPIKPSLSEFDTLLAIFQPTLLHLPQFIAKTLLFMFAFATFHKITKNWQENKKIAILISLFYGLIWVGTVSLQTLSAENLVYWVFFGLIVGCLMIFVYKEFVRFSFSTLPILMLVIYSLTSVKTILYDAYPLVVFGSFLSVIMILLFGFLWAKKFEK